MSEFWEMTPDELNLSAEIYAEKKKQDEQNLIIQAYLISRWVWTEKIPIEKILEEMGTKKEKKEMTDEQMLTQVKTLNTIFGGEVKTCNP
jgi:hypothetical protein